MPSDLFYKINFSLFISFLIIGLIFSLCMLMIIIFHRRCHTVDNLVIADLCVASILFSVSSLIGSVYGFRENWSSYQPLCSFRAYLIVVSITSASYSFLIQAISRLSFTLFRTNRIVLTWRTHRILIILKWFISLLVSVEPFFIKHGFTLIKEYRMCGATTKILSVALYIIIISFMFPGSIIVIVYGIILHRVRYLTRRIVPGVFSIQCSLPCARKNLEIMNNILLVVIILTIGGIPYLILTFWNVIQHASVPKMLYFISVNSLTLSCSSMAIALFFKNKIVKEIAFGYFCKTDQF